MKISIKRLNDAVHMEARNEEGATLHMDGTPDIGGIEAGFRPMQMLMAAVGGCAAIDVVGILQKQRQKLDDLQIEVEGERINVDDYTQFSKVHIHFKLSGDLDEHKVSRAVQLSLEKYCSVAKTLEKTAKITSSFEIV